MKKHKLIAFRLTNIQIGWLTSILLIYTDQIVKIDALQNEQTFTNKKLESNNNNNKWYITFTTGKRLWAGTDSDIYVELFGDKEKSEVIFLTPNKTQLEAKSRDTFELGNLNDRDIGKLTSIIIAKQYTVGFFSDWELSQVIVTDPQNKKYVFECNCWLTNSRNKRRLTVIPTDDNLFGSDKNTFSLSRTARVFPITIILLSLFLVLILFSYFGNVLCKKWRRNLQFLNDLRNGRTSFSRGHSSNNFGRPNQTSSIRIDEYENRNRRQIYNNQDQHCVNIPLQLTTMEDKPPDYKELFPISESNHNDISSRQKIEEAILSTNEQLNAPLLNSLEQANATANSNTNSTNASINDAQANLAHFSSV